MEDVIVIGGGPVGFITALGLTGKNDTADTIPLSRALDAAHVTSPTGGLGHTSGLLDSYALYPALAAVVLEGADDEVLDRYSAARRDTFVNRVSPQATSDGLSLESRCPPTKSLQMLLRDLEERSRSG